MREANDPPSSELPHQGFLGWEIRSLAGISRQAGRAWASSSRQSGVL